MMQVARSLSSYRVVRFGRDGRQYLFGARREVEELLRGSASYRPVRYPESASVLRDCIRAGHARSLFEVARVPASHGVDELRQALDHDLSSSRPSLMLVAAVPVALPVQLEQELPEPPRLEPIRRPEPRPEPELTWLELEVVDDDGIPLAYKRFEVTLPGGEVRRGALNASGYARIERVAKSGTAQVAFPELGREYVLQRAS